MAVEDAALLGTLLSHISSLGQLRHFLHAYEALRLPRTAETQVVSRSNQKIFHLPDGQEQRARDERMRQAVETELQIHEDEHVGLFSSASVLEDNLNQWADGTKMRYNLHTMRMRWQKSGGKMWVSARLDQWATARSRGSCEGVFASGLVKLLITYGWTISPSTLFPRRC
ncbi:hypothetical protein AcV5_001855 [Taiwanofungus camphoratus]|nr:hypothetical protein AcV5_001855 [Antrodia cinnamomea]